MRDRRASPTFAPMMMPPESADFSQKAAPIPAVLRRHPGFWALWLFAQLPMPALHACATGLAWLLSSVIRYRRRVIDTNLLKSFPEKTDAERKRIAWRFYRNLADVLVETIKLLAITPIELSQRVQVTGGEPLLAYMREGKTVLAMGSHMVNWEWILPSAIFSLGSTRIDGVYRPLEGAFGEALIKFLRTRFGGHLVRMQDVGRDVVRLRAIPRALSMVADQTPPGGEIQFYTRFLNQDTPFFVGPDKLASSFRMPVFFLSQTRTKRGHYRYDLQLHYDGTTQLPVPPKHATDDPTLHPITAAYAQFLEAEIRRSPADYLWSHRRWKNSRPGK
jgi:Kdo2-lipid IVA lauroyltransferase/acyltransferase